MKVKAADRYKIKLTEQEFEDMLSAIDSAIDSYRETQGAVKFVAALKKLEKKLWKIKKSGGEG